MQRYMVDYAWILIIASICVCIKFYNIYRAEETKRIIAKVFGIITIYTIIINCCSGIVSEKSFMRYNSPKEYYNLKYSINFWE